MRADVNGEECTISVEGIDTIGDLVQQLEIHAPPGDVIVGLRINGGECDSDPASQIRKLPVGGVEEIGIQTRSPQAFARDARNRLHEYLAMIHGRFERAVECFDSQADADGLEYYRLGVEELRLMVTLWDQLNRLDTSMSGADDVVRRDLQGICDHLFAAQDRKDLAKVRSVVDERLLPLLRSWGAQVER